MALIQTLCLLSLSAVNIMEYGASGDGVALNTISIQAAIDAAADKGGGEVLFPADVYPIENI